LFATLAVAIQRWPGHKQAALAADRQLVLEERLATAVELVLTRPLGRFDALQIRDALLQARATRQTAWLMLDRRARIEALAGVGVIALAVASYVLAPSLPRPLATPELAPEATAVVAPDDLLQQALPLDSLLAEQTSQPAQSAQPAQPDANLANRVQQEQAEQASLNQLAQALSSVSAGQSAANDIQQGDFGDAHDELQNLGDQADQLSAAAKKQLANALQQAAMATAQSDRQLANTEHQAAQALSKSTYTDQRQALRALADQVQRSGTQSVPQDQLARDVGQLQQQSAAGLDQSAATQQASQQAAQLGTEDPGQTDQRQAARATSAGLSSAGTGEQGGPGMGTGTSQDLFGNPSSKLDTSGQSVQVPTKLGNGPGVRPADGITDQSVADPSLNGQSVSQRPQAQQTGQVLPETNLVPGEQRPVVRGYFR
jgi:hypothetical protein